MKNRKELLQKLGIEALNPMQEEAHLAIQHMDEVVLLSPTGSGKTLAFLLPIVEKLKADIMATQAIIIAPSRELVLQIEQVARDMGSGLKINAVYGGQALSKDKQHLQHPPHLLIATPGRLADHLRNRRIDGRAVEFLVLDEFDKSLEIGFTEEIIEIFELLPNIQQKVLSSATKALEIPAFVGMNKAMLIDYSHQQPKALEILKISSPKKDKLETLVKALAHLGDKTGIIFCNYRDSIERVSSYLFSQGISHACFHGGLEQQERERSLIKFRNATHQLLLATDLAARGIDIPELQFIIHYHLPAKAEEFTHRNGRTARMHKAGKAFVIQWTEELLPDFMGHPDEEILVDQPLPHPSEWTTLFISGGRKDKISKGDIAGLFFKQGKLKPEDLGVIELKSDCAFVAVKKKKLKQLLGFVNNQRLKKKKVKVFEI